MKWEKYKTLPEKYKKKVLEIEISEADFLKYVLPTFEKNQSEE